MMLTRQANCCSCSSSRSVSSSSRPAGVVVAGSRRQQWPRARCSAARRPEEQQQLEQGQQQLDGASRCISQAECSSPAAAAGAAAEAQQQQQPVQQASSASSASSFAAALALFLLTEAPPALADAADSPFQGVTANSLYVTLGLFLLTAPGIWSQVKRAPTAVKKRVTFEVPGPADKDAPPLDARARQIFAYFKKYNYQVKETGEVIAFEGVYAPDRGQAAAVTFYTFAGLASVALVLSIVVPAVGNYWYALTLLTPAAWLYYFSRGERVETVRVKMVTSDDERTTDITVEGDREEITRLSKELGLVEKGMVRVKGILEA